MSGDQAETARRAPEAPAETPSEDGFVWKTGLYSAAPFAALLGQLEAGWIARPSSREELYKQWKSASQVYGRSPNPSRSFLGDRDLSGVDNQINEATRILLRRVKSHRPFDTSNVQFYNIPLRKLITPQLNVTDTRVSAHEERISSSSSEHQKLEYVSGRGYRDPEVKYQVLGLSPNSGAYLFTSPYEDVRIHLPPRMVSIPVNDADPESGTVPALCFAVGEGLPFIHAYKFVLTDRHERLVLANGIHRVVAALRRGVSALPLAVVDFRPGDLPNPFVELNLDYVLNPTADLPLVADFLNKQICMRLGFYGSVKGIRLNWNLEPNPILRRD